MLLHLLGISLTTANHVGRLEVASLVSISNSTGSAWNSTRGRWKAIKMSSSFRPLQEDDFSNLEAFKVPSKKCSVQKVKEELSKAEDPLLGTEYYHCAFIWVFSKSKQKWFRFNREQNDDIYANTVGKWITRTLISEGPDFIPPAGTDLSHFGAFQVEDPSDKHISVGKAVELLNKQTPAEIGGKSEIYVYSTSHGRYYKLTTGQPRSHPTRTILIQGGCFCPPHKGHFKNTQNFYDKVDEIYIGAYSGSKSRHGYSTYRSE